MFRDFESCYRAVDSRDARFDGWFVTAVTSTGIYCRPSCPAVTPKRANVRFLPSAAAAQREGFRACLRCRPDSAPGSPEWNYRADVVGRAMRLIADGVVDREGVPGLAARLGYTERHLGRLLRTEVGAGPLALARAQRAHAARVLIETTTLGIAEIAFAAGFGSVRQFNDTIRETYGKAPTELRVPHRGPGPSTNSGTISLRLPYREPLHGSALFEFLAARTIRGVDDVTDGVYRRGLRLPHGAATVEIELTPGYAQTTLHLSDVRDLAPAVARCRRLLDLDADPVAVDAALGADPALAPLVAKEPGVRVPGSADGFELLVRAVVGQQISVAGARKVLARLAATSHHPVHDSVDHSAPDAIHDPFYDPVHDSVDHELEFMINASGRPQDHDQRDRGGSQRDCGGGLAAFPSAGELAEAPDEAFRMPAARRRTLRTLAAAVADGTLNLDPGADRAEMLARLLTVPGIGPWTAQYVALRALGDPDVVLPTDLGARRGAAALGLADDPAGLAAHAHRWAPWRSYATVRLWRQA
jgi:AraC family transcriptional regulator, regulatory protein of adaptative response / DNA-3-methyladenine glycosylase II